MGPFGIPSGTLWGPFLAPFGNLWNPVWNLLGPLLGSFGSPFGTLWDPLGPFWDPRDPPGTRHPQFTPRHRFATFALRLGPFGSFFGDGAPVRSENDTFRKRNGDLNSRAESWRRSTGLQRKRFPTSPPGIDSQLLLYVYARLAPFFATEHRSAAKTMLFGSETVT